MISFFDFVDNFIFYFLSDFDFMQRIYGYFNTDFLDNNNLYRLYKYLIIFIILSVFSKIFRKKYKYYDFMMRILAYGLFIMAVWAKYPFFGERFAAPCWLSLIFLLPLTIKLSNNKIYRIIIYLLLLFITLNSYISNLTLIEFY